MDFVNLPLFLKSTAEQILVFFLYELIDAGPSEVLDHLTLRGLP